MFERPIARQRGQILSWTGQLPRDTASLVRKVARAAAVARVRADIIDDLTIGLSEALNNVAEHAYFDRVGGVWLQAEFRQDAVRVSLSDHGRAMPGERLPAGELPKMDPDLGKLPEGGFGWFLLRELTDNMRYVRQDGRNALQLTFGKWAEVGVAKDD